MPIVHGKNNDGQRICTCLSMSAGIYVVPMILTHTKLISYQSVPSYLWMSETKRVHLPAHKYMALIYDWVSKKLDDPTVFPTDPLSVSSSHYAALPGSKELTDEHCWIGKRSGFPENFENICRIILRHMFRIYAYLFWNHFIEPFYHLKLESSLNSAFAHFLTTAIEVDMLDSRELEPMQALLDLFVVNGTIRTGSKAYQFAQP